MFLVSVEGDTWWSSKITHCYMSSGQCPCKQVHPTKNQDTSYMYDILLNIGLIITILLVLFSLLKAEIMFTLTWSLAIFSEDFSFNNGLTF